MIPVSLFVIGPHVAQHVLDQSVVSLPNLTQAACPSTPDGDYTWLINHVSVHVPGIGPVKVDSTILPYKQEVWTTACEKDGVYSPASACSDPTEHQMGFYTSEEMTVSPGDNNRTFNVSMTSNFTLITNAWVVPLFLSGGKTRLILKAKDVSVKVMGITFKGLHMENKMTCHGAANGAPAPAVSIPNRVCYPKNLKEQSYSTMAFTAVCTAGFDESIATSTTTIIAPNTTTTQKTVDRVIV